MSTTTSSTETVLNALRWRYATKKFDPARTIPAPAWSALEEALVLSPSSLGLQPWKFFVVRDPAARRALSAASHGQTQPVDCSHFVVFALRTDVDPAYVDRFIGRISEVRGAAKESLKGYHDLVQTSTDKARAAGRLDAWMSRQVYIALGQFMAAAALLGVDTCPMEGFDPAKYDEILSLGRQHCTALCACAAGYRAADDKYAALAKVRFQLADVVSHV